MQVSAMLAGSDSTAVAIRTDLAQIESTLSEFQKISDGLEDLATRFPVDLVYDVSTTKGMNEAIAHRAAWRDPRVNVEKFRKIGKAPVLALGKNIDARAAWLTEQLLIGETPVDKQIKAEERRKEDEKQAKISAEFGRVQAIEEALGELHVEAMSVASKPSGMIEAAIASMRALVLDPAIFQEKMPEAEQARRMAVERMEQSLKARLFTEAEIAKLAAERAELEELRKAAAAQRIKDEQAAREKQAVEREAARAEQERLNAEFATARAEADKQAQEARRKAQEEHEAAMKAQREALAEQTRLATEKAEREAAKKRKAEAAEKKLRDAAPKMLAALHSVRGHITDPNLLKTVDEAIAAAT